MCGPGSASDPRGMTNTALTAGLTTTEMVDSVKRFYDGYARHDLDAALAELSDDVDWAAEAAGEAAPWYGVYLGRESVPGFFAAIASNVDISEFDVQSFATSERDVIATVHWTYTVKATGRTASMYMQHWFRFENGKIAFFRGSEDSAQTVAAFS